MQAEGNKITIKKFSTLLGSLVMEKKKIALNTLSLNKKTLKASMLLDKEIIGQYEAMLTYCCYHSRLAYEFKQSKIQQSENSKSQNPNSKDQKVQELK